MYGPEIVGADLALGTGRAGSWLAGADDAGPSLNQLHPSLAAALAPIAAQQAFVRELAARNASAVVERTPGDSRTLMVPFPETNIPSGASRDVIALPQFLFRGERLVIPSDIAGLVVLDDIRVGANSQYGASGGVPGRLFSEVAVGVGFLFDTAQPGIQILLRVRNISGNDVMFRASLLGRSVR
jgi:hypothetical protein